MKHFQFPDGGTPNATGSHRERDEHYLHVILRDGDWRVIVCKDNFQWILQRRTRAESTDGARWEARGYCRTREALVRLWAASTGGEGEALLVVLPELFSRSGARS